MAEESALRNSFQDVSPKIQREAQHKKIKWKDAVPQIVACCTAQSIVIHAGINMSFTAIMIPQLLGPESTIRINRDSASWIASMVAVTTPIGSLLAGPMMDWLGRRAACLLSCTPFLAAWLMLPFAGDVALINISRALAGLGGGLSTASVVYVSEVAEPSLRPALLCMNSVFVSLGILLNSLLGLWLSWQVMAGVFAALIAVSAAAMWALPESPHWLLNMAPDRQEEARTQLARASLHWLYRTPEQFDCSWERLLECSSGAIGGAGARSGEDQQLLHRRVRAMSTFLQPATAKPLLIMSVLFIVQQLSGTYAIVFYAVPVFQEIGGKIGTVVDEFGAMVIMSSVRMAASFATALLSQRFGRRPLMMVSGTGMCVCALLAALLLETPVARPSVVAVNSTAGVSIFESASQHADSWPALVLILLFVVLSAVGFLVIPWTLVSELLPLESRGTGGGIMVCLAYVLMFGVVKSFPYAMDALGARTMFLVFGSVSLSGAVFVYFFLPETLGKTFKQIERQFVRIPSDDDT